MPNTKQICTFLLADQLFGIEVHHVQEVLVAQRLTKIPLADRVVSGLINLRGQIVTVIDLRGYLDLPPRAAAATPLNLIVRIGEELASFLVDRMADVVDVDEALFEPPPETAIGAATDAIVGAYKLDGRLLLLLNTEKIVEHVTTLHESRGSS